MLQAEIRNSSDNKTSVYDMHGHSRITFLVQASCQNSGGLSQQGERALLSLQ